MRNDFRRGNLWGVFIVAAVFVACGGSDAEKICPPGARFCDYDTVRECLPDGSGSFRVVDCAPEATCKNGACVPMQIVQDATPAADDPPVVDIAVPTDTDPGPSDSSAVETLPDGSHLDLATLDQTSADPPSPPDLTDSDLLSDEALTSDDMGPGDLETASQDVFPADVSESPSDLGPMFCGNARLDPGEECDGKDLGSKTCTSLGYGPGELTCRTDCTLDTLLCGPDSHRLVFEAVLNAWYKDDFVDVAWHPAGTYAVILNRAGAVVRYDPVAEPLQALALVGSTGKVTPTRVAFAPSGDAFVVGYDGEGMGHVFRVPNGGETIEDLPEARKPSRFVSIKFDPSGQTAMIVGQSSTYTVNHLCVFDPVLQTITLFKGYNASAGVTDLTFVPPGILPAGLAALLVHGWNGKDAKLWYAISNEIVPTPGNIASFGNMGRASWRPGGLYGLVSGTSSNVVYIFNGTWDKASLTDSGSGILDVAFRADGRRALLIGQPFGSPLTYHLIEHRPRGDQFAKSDFLAQHITNWGSKPFFADSNTRLLAVAFRPGVRCDEGLLVGQDPSPSWNPSFGIVVRFRDTDMLDCP